MHYSVCTNRTAVTVINQRQLPTVAANIIASHIPLR